MNILYEDNHIIAVEKPTGVLIQGDFSGEESLLDQVRTYIKNAYGKPGNVYLGLVHRLDKPVSGAVVFARTTKAARRLHREFKTRNVLKLYLALVHNTGNTESMMQSEGWHELKQMVARQHDKTVIVNGTDPRAQEAALSYLPLSRNEKYALLLVRMYTGRKHQIRAQLASVHMPVVGDMKYGSLEQLDDHAICLHSWRLQFTHPTLRTPLNIISAIPERIRKRIEIENEIHRHLSHSHSGRDRKQEISGGA